MDNENLRTNLRRAHMHSVAKDNIIEGAQAQLVIQNLHLQKMNGALFNKEKEKRSERTLIFEGGKGQVFSSDTFVAKIQSIADQKEAEAARKAQNAKDRAAKRDARAKLEAEWARLKSQHEEAMQQWKLECARLKADGVQKKSWPKGPGRLRKPKLPDDLADVADGVQDEEEQGGDVFDNHAVTPVPDGDNL